MAEINNVIIIGSGPAGYTAAIYAARANLKPILVSGFQPGGQLTITTDVENYPGYEDPIQGPWLMDQMQKQAAHVGTEIINSQVTEVFLNEDIKKLNLDNGTTLNAKTVIISTGAQARWLGLENESKFQGHGLSACATCDGFFFKDKEVAVIGGGNSAAEEALFLTKFATKVYLIHRRDKLRAEKILQDRLKENSKIEFIWNSEVTKFNGNDDLESIDLLNKKDNQTSTLKIDGVFIAIGHDPATQLFKGQLKMDDGGYIITDPDSTKTSIDGVFAAGDVADSVYRQAVTAAGLGCMAALDANRWLEANGSSTSEAA